MSNTSNLDLENIRVLNDGQPVMEQIVDEIITRVNANNLKINASQTNIIYKIDDISEIIKNIDAENIPITDTYNRFVSNNVEGALNELELKSMSFYHTLLASDWYSYEEGFYSANIENPFLNALPDGTDIELILDIMKYEENGNIAGFWTALDQLQKANIQGALVGQEYKSLFLIGNATMPTIDVVVKFIIRRT